jgi:hypothetical protein
MDERVLDQLKKVCADRCLRQLMLNSSEQCESVDEALSPSQEFLLGLKECCNDGPHMDICS